MKRLNNRGQVLIIFVALIPVIILFFTFIVDYSLILYNQNKLNSVNKTALYYVRDKKDDYSVDKVRNLVIRNDNTVNILVCEEKNNTFTLKLEKTIDSIFGRIIGRNTYTITSTYKLDMNNKTIIKE